MEENTFTITPMSQNISLDPGTTYTGYITIINPTDSTTDFSYKASVTPFGVNGESYDIDLLTEYNRSMISKWITIPEPTGKLKPGESTKLEFQINVPENAPSGGQYATIAVSSDNAVTGSNEGLAVQNVLEMASVVYATVAGETVHDGEILENNIPSFSVSPPVTLSAMIKNDGNVHDYAYYSITVTDFFTGQVILPNEEADGQYADIIMPETTYLSQREVSNLPMVGIVKVKQTVRFNGKASTEEGNIIICPIWFMLLIILTIAALITSIVLIIKKHRKNKASKTAT